MAHFLSNTAFNSTGEERIDVGFVPAWYKLSVHKKYNTTQNFTHLAEGTYSSGNDVVQSYSIFQDGTGGKTDDPFETDDPTTLIKHYERISSSITPVLKIRHDEIDGTEIVLNIVTANVNYNVTIEAGS